MEFIHSSGFWSAVLKVFLATGVFAVYRISTSSRWLSRFIGRARGMLLTFPVLNGVGLVMAEAGSAETKAAAMLPMIAINGLLFAGYLLNFELLSSRLPNHRCLPAAIGLVAIVIWGFEATFGFGIPAAWQLLFIAGYGIIALWISVAFWNDQPPDPKRARHGLWIFFFALVVVAYLWIAQNVPDRWTGEFGAFPIIGVVALISDSTGAYDPKKLRELRATALLGPIVAMFFVWIVWPRAGHGFWFAETVSILIPLWLVCLGAIALVNFAYRAVQAKIQA